jgi:hypothetical protein
MAGRIIVGAAIEGQGAFAKDVNRVVKQHRGKNRPFLIIVVEDDGNATVLSNMDNFAQRIQLLEQTAVGLVGRTGTH